MSRRTPSSFRLLSLLILVVGGRALAADSERLGYAFEYDHDGRVVKVVDAAGREARLDYQSLPDGRLRAVRTRADRATTVRELDPRGRLSVMQDAAGSVQYSYDDRGRLAQVVRQGSPPIRYGHDLYGRTTSLDVGDLYRVRYGYDFLGRLVTVQTPAGEIRYEYLTGQGELRRFLPNGIKTIWRFASNGELVELIHADAQDRLLAAYAFDRRPDGLLAASREQDARGTRTVQYEYDKIGRLLVSAEPGRQHRFEYDQLGNATKMIGPARFAQTMTYDWAGRLATIGGKACANDGAGNLTKLPLGGDDVTYVHDQDGLLVEAGGGHGCATYRYDGDGRLVARTEAGKTTTFVANPEASVWQPLVADEQGGSRTLWVWAGQVPLLAIRKGGVEYYLHDHLGSVRLVVDAQGKIVQQLDYEPYGALASASARQLAPRFAGLFWDPVAEVYLTASRAYSPRLGRFLQPEAQPLGMSYVYAAAAPNNWIDRSGHATSEAWPGEDEVVRRAAELYRTGHRFQADWTLLRFSLGDAPKALDRLIDQPFVAMGAEAERHNHKILALGIAAAGTALQTGKEIFGSLPLSVFGAFSPEAKPLDYVMLAASLPILRAPLEAGQKANFLTSILNRESVVDRADRALYGALTAKATSNWVEETIVGVPGFNGQRALVRQEPNLSQRLAMDARDKLFVPETNFWVKLVTGRDMVGPVALANDVADMTNRVTDAVGDTVKARLQASTESKKSEPRAWGNRAEPQELVDNSCKHGLCGGPPPPPPPPSIGLAMLASGSRCKAGGWDDGPPPSAGGASRVGGVYLSGAGRMLDGIGIIDGVAVDANHNLVLLGTTGPIKLPPLRLDDVVTVFRSVYLHGEGPSVTIDPVPEKPTESAMIIRHGRATEATYVGWVLYQADRLMKGYSLGYDNLTNQPVSTAIPGYTTVLDQQYFGGALNAKPTEGSQWQRFWIVPAEIRRFGSQRDLTLFDVPLALRTQAMVWKNGQLVDDQATASSPGASQFRDWFTANYDAIAAERFLMPPKESGIATPVPVFSELRRIALVTAIAERLRESGVPMPWWMRDYPVKPVPFEKITPGLEVTRSNGNVRARIFGGVDLSVPDGNVRIVASGADLAKLPAEEKTRSEALLVRAVDATEDPRVKLAGLPPLEVARTELGGTKVSALSLPGAATIGLNPCQLQETDLLIPITDGFAIKLERKYNSFFSPLGTFGRGWSMDLPRLDPIVATVARAPNGQVQMHKAFELASPLGSVYARLDRIAKVPELGGSQLQIPDDATSVFWGLAEGKTSFLSRPTAQLVAKNGGAWHFNQAGGEIVASEQGGARTVYERDEHGRLTRIVGALGKSVVGFIALTYDAQGRIAQATAHSELGSEDAKVGYAYDRDGRLVAVTSGDGKVGYRYQGDLLTDVVTGADRVVRSFHYNPRGQLESVAYGDAGKVAYAIRAEAGGNTIESTWPGGETESLKLDSTMRPLHAQLPDGSQIDWRRDPDGTSHATVVGKNAEAIRLVEAADGKRRVLELGKHYSLAAEFDQSGRLRSLAENGAPVLEQDWRPDGSLRRVADGTTAVYPEYDDEGLAKRVLIAPAGQHGDLSEWRATNLDGLGRAREITDFRGLRELMDYDNAGRLVSAAVVRGGKNYGFQIQRDGAGRVSDVVSSWGDRHYGYDSAGRLAKVEIRRGEATTSAEWQGGRLRKATQYDGGVHLFDYDQAGSGKPVLRQMTTPEHMIVTYSHDRSNRLAGVAVANVSHLRVDYDGNGRVKNWTYEPIKPGRR